MPDSLLHLIECADMCLDDEKLPIADWENLKQ